MSRGDDELLLPLRLVSALVGTPRSDLSSLLFRASQQESGPDRFGPLRVLLGMDEADAASATEGVEPQQPQTQPQRGTGPAHADAAQPLVPAPAHHAPQSARADAVPPKPAHLPAEAASWATGNIRNYEQSLRQQASVAGRIAEQLRQGRDVAGPPAAEPLQQRVRLLVLDGVGSGRFVLINDAQAPLNVRFEAQPPNEMSSEAWQKVRIQCTPKAALPLAPGDETFVDLEVDLRACAVVAGFESVIDVVGGDALLGKVWVSVLVR